MKFHLWDPPGNLYYNVHTYIPPPASSPPKEQQNNTPSFHRSYAIIHFTPDTPYTLFSTTSEISYYTVSPINGCKPYHRHDVTNTIPQNSKSPTHQINKSRQDPKTPNQKSKSQLPQLPHIRHHHTSDLTTFHIPEHANFQKTANPKLPISPKGQTSKNQTTFKTSASSQKPPPLKIPPRAFSVCGA